MRESSGFRTKQAITATTSLKCFMTDLEYISNKRITLLDEPELLKKNTSVDTLAIHGGMDKVIDDIRRIYEVSKKYYGKNIYYSFKK